VKDRGAGETAAKCGFTLRGSVPTKVDKDYTFFKVILTTTPADFSMLIQDDPLLVTQVEHDAGTRRATTSRTTASEPSRTQKLHDANARARAFFRAADEAKEFFSRNFVVLQTKT
jgi:hypothetical protein